MSFLLDTNVLSEFRKGARCDPRVAAWRDANRTVLPWTSVLCVGEVRCGIERVRGRDPAFAAALDAWLQALVLGFGDRVLPVEAAAADLWGRWDARQTLPAVDGLIAATAAVHGLTLVTRDTQAVAWTGVAVLDPFGA